MTFDLPERLESERLILRAMTDSDCANVADAANDPDIVRWMARLPYPYTIDDAKEWLAMTRQHRAEHSELNLLAERKQDSQFVGFVSIFLQFGEMGYWVGKKFWRYGYATEMAKRMIQWAFENGGFDRVFSASMPDNDASQRVMQKAGMVFEGMRDYDFLERNGGIKPAPHYVLYRKDWPRI